MPPLALVVCPLPAERAAARAAQSLLAGLSRDDVVLFCPEPFQAPPSWERAFRLLPLADLPSERARGAVSAPVWLLDGGAIAASEVAIGARGSVVGDGRIAATLVNGGALRPGNGLGTMAVQGDYRQTAGGSLEIEIGAAAHDLLEVEGGAVLAGLLVVGLEDGHVPRIGEEFPVVVGGRGVQGRFDGAEEPPAREWHRMAFDQARGMAFSFGGNLDTGASIATHAYFAPQGSYYAPGNPSQTQMPSVRQTVIGGTFEVSYVVPSGAFGTLLLMDRTPALIPALTLDPSEGETSAQDGYTHLAPVTAFAGASGPHGTVQMAGNVWEWTADAYAPLSAQEQRVDPITAAGLGMRVVRGGSFRAPAFALRVTHREPRPEAGAFVDAGVRCAYDPPRHAAPVKQGP